MAHAPRALTVFCLSVILAVAAVRVPGPVLQAQGTVAPGGFVVSAVTDKGRPRLSVEEMRRFLPAPHARGIFKFPSPYLTRGVRITNVDDCPQSGPGYNNDCVTSVGYSYWRRMNNHVGSNIMLIFLTLRYQNTTGPYPGPTLFSYNKRSGETLNLGSLFPNVAYATPEHEALAGRLRNAFGESWYFSATEPNIVYLAEDTGTQFLRYDVVRHTFEVVFDLESTTTAAALQDDGLTELNGLYLQQLHSSNDGQVHSATLRRFDGTNYLRLGCVVHDGAQTPALTRFFPKNDLHDAFDECQVDKSGRWLVIKEDLDGVNGEDNRVIDLRGPLGERHLLDADGAAGHSDLGWGWMVAEDNFAETALGAFVPGAVRLWNLAEDMSGGQPPAVPVRRETLGQGGLVYQTKRSDEGHIAFSHARPTTPIPGPQTMPIFDQTACRSSANGTDNKPRMNEVVCFRLDGSLKTLIVAPTLVDFRSVTGGDPDPYWRLPKGNTDVTGEYFIWAANAGTSRLDAYVVRIPPADWGR
jgi:hypothetical protein